MPKREIFVQSFVFNPFQENTYIIHNVNKECIIIDPGCGTTQEKEILSYFIREQDLCVRHLINTHGHIDHILGNHYIKNTYQARLAIHALDVPLLQKAAIYAPEYGITNYEPTTANILLRGGETIGIKDATFEVLNVPGHSPGHIALYSTATKLCFSGDVLFQGSIGRTDLPGGNKDILLESIEDQLFTLDDDVIVYPGHGDTTTIGQEKGNNPFFMKK